MTTKMADPVVLIVDGDEEDIWLRREGERRAGRGDQECDAGGMIEVARGELT